MAISEDTFFLDPTGTGTLQKQIQRIVAEGILSGRFRPGEKLPSSRGLAQHLGISRITVTLAYTELVADDYLASRGRSGYFVSDNAPRPPVFAPARATREDAVDWARLIGTRYSSGPKLSKPADWRKFRYPFIYGQADPTLFDHKNWRLCAIQALGYKDFDALTVDYFDRDDPKLVEFIARHTLPRRGILARPEEILVTLGAQNALWLTAQVLLTQRRTAVMEDPGYPGLREILNQTRCNMAMVDVDENGLPPDRIPEHADVVFATPSHHCPTGATMPLARRQELIRRAAHHNWLIVEDDYEFEIAFQNPPSPALKSLDHDGRVIHVGSFSKSLFPGLRLGYLVGPEAFIREARALRATVLRHPPGNMQRTAAYFLSLGHYDALIRRMGQIFQTRRMLMEQALTSNGLSFAGPSAGGGSSFWMRADEGVDTQNVSYALANEGVLIEPGTLFFNDARNHRNTYRLAYSSIPVERIPEGVARIAAAMRSA
ncbi:MAG: PLP-dependent aminotransferase family protein [Pseudomonadota bacterium]